MKCKLLVAMHLPGVDGFVGREGALLVEILVTQANGEFPYSIYQRGQRGVDQKLVEPCLRAAGQDEVVGQYSDAARGIDRKVDYCVIGVLRGYSKDERIVTPGGELDVRLTKTIPRHLAEMFRHCNRPEVSTWDDD